MIVPAAGAKSRRGSSALILTSIACPERGARPVSVSRSPGRDSELLAHDVDARGHLGHWMLDLEAAVDLDERRRAVGAEQELERPCVDVPELAARTLDRRLHRLARLGRERERRRLLDELLVATLDRALALAEREHAALAVSQSTWISTCRAGTSARSR